MIKRFKLEKHLGDEEIQALLYFNSEEIPQEKQMLKPVRRAVLAMLSDIKIKHRQSSMTKTSEIETDPTRFEESQLRETGRSEKQQESDGNDSNEEISESSQSTDGSEVISEAEKEKMPRANKNKSHESEDSDDSFSFFTRDEDETKKVKFKGKLVNNPKMGDKTVEWTKESYIMKEPRAKNKTTFDMSQLSQALDQPTTSKNVAQAQRISVADILEMPRPVSTQTKVDQILRSQFLDYNKKFQDFAKTKSEARVEPTQEMFDEEMIPLIEDFITRQRATLLTQSVPKIIRH